MEDVTNGAVSTEEQPQAQQTQGEAPPSDAKPAGEAQGNEAAQQQEDTPEKRESRSRRRFNRERDARIAAETELRLLKERMQAPPAAQEDGAPKRESFETYEAYLEAKATHAADQAAARRIAEERKRESESRATEQLESAKREWEGKIDKARQSVEDFDEVCAESDAVVTPAMSAAIMESDVGPMLAYYLAKNPAEAERIASLKPSKQAAAIVAIEEKVAKPAKQPSKAPAPINPVGVKGGAEDVSTDDPRSDKLSTTEWIAREKARMEKAGVRI